ncbi:ribosome maturation factor RimM [Saccharicrinis carchari]|nr:hypothetical protein [Saccharicrinis carchari]
MIQKEDTTQIGFIQKTHGVKGELTLLLIEGINSEELDMDFLFLDIDKGLVPFYVESYRVKGTKSILVKLEGVDSESRAGDLCGTAVYVGKQQLEALDEMPDVGYVGYRVYDKKKGCIGSIRAVVEIVNNPLFALDFENKEILFPIHPDFIIASDDTEKTLHVDLPEGLIDIYLEEPDDEELG